MTCWPLAYWDWIEEEAALINSDGCSKVTGAYRKHCLVHDLSYYYARDPRDAYARYKAGAAGYWRRARIITKGDADAAFRRGMQSDSPAGFFSPLAFFRWLGVKLGGRSAWNTHRAREAHESEVL